ncbi:MAG: PD40 domain-containing protein [Acidobacteria bacterium]|nr:PD40 domain-containing protein [Acidobacteriota bacterium]
MSDTLAAVLTREVDWTKLPSTTPPRIVALLRDCLVRDPKQRLRDMGEARRVLDQLITGVSSSSMIAPASSSITASAPPAAVWRRALPWAIAGLATAVAAGAAWRSVSVKPIASPVTRSRVTFKETTLLIDVSRDGTKVVYARAAHLEVRHVDQFDGVTLPGTSDADASVFSPAGDWIAFGAGDGKIKKTPSAGGPIVTLTDGSLINGATWGDDDTIVFSGATGLMRVPASGGTAEPLTRVDKDKWVVDLARGTPTRLTFGGANDNPIWTPDGRTIVYGGNKDGKPGLYKVPADGSGQPQLMLATLGHHVWRRA